MQKFRKDNTNQYYWVDLVSSNSDAPGYYDGSTDGDTLTVTAAISQAGGTPVKHTNQILTWSDDMGKWRGICIANWLTSWDAGLIILTSPAIMRATIDFEISTIDIMKAVEIVANGTYIITSGSNNSKTITWTSPDGDYTLTQTVDSSKQRTSSVLAVV